MSKAEAVKGVYIVTDTRIQDRYSHLELARFAAEEGAAAIQFRDKQTGTARKLEVLNNIISICRRNDCTTIVNNRVDLQMASGADGVHLGQEDIPIERARELMDEEILIGGTASTLAEAKTVEEAGGDYVGFGHIFETKTKPKDYPPRGTDRLAEVVSELSIPVVAIGGITALNADRVLKTGVAGIAVTSAVCKSDNPREAVNELVNLYNKREEIS